MGEKIKLIISFISLVVAVSLGMMLYKYKEVNVEDTLGYKAVMYLYNFDKVEDLALQDIELKKICTDEAYEYLTVTDSDRALNTYLKFKKLPTKVEVIDNYEGTGGGYIVYTLRNNNISYGRKFIMFYKISGGKLDNPKEMEGIDFKKGI